MQWLIDLLGVGILIGGFVSFQNNRHKHIVMMKVGTDLLFTAQYLLLGAYSGALMDLIGIVRNLILMRTADDRKKQAIATSVFVVILTAAGIATWAGPISLLAIIGKTFTTVAFGFRNPRILRALTIPSCILWAIYDVLTGSWAGMLYELLGLLSIIIAYVRFDLIPYWRQKRETDQNNALPHE